MNDPIKVIIWAVPRSRSTALLQSLSGIKESKIFHELFSTAFYYGPDSNYDPCPPDKDPPTIEEGDETDTGYVFPSSICTYEWVRTILEKDYPCKKVVLSKEIIHCLDQKYGYLPKGYRHVFLLRHPSKAFTSLKILCHGIIAGENVPIDDFVLDQKVTIKPPGVIFQEAYKLFEYLKEKQLDENPIIIDGDDLMDNPAGILSALCGKLGIPYSDSLLTWDKGLKDTWTMGKRFKMMIEHSPGFGHFRNSTGFQKREYNKQASASPGEAKVTADIQCIVDFSMPYYLKMHEQRLKVDQD